MASEKTGPIQPGQPPSDDEPSTNFVDGLIERGEAAAVNPDGSLPSGATHELVVGPGNEKVTVVRRRFSIK